MILVLERKVKDNYKCNLSILSLKPDAFTEIRFFEDKMQINSKTSFDSYLDYKYSDWAIKYFLDIYNDKGDITFYEKYLQEELFKRFQLLDEKEKLEDPKSKTINEDLGILGN